MKDTKSEKMQEKESKTLSGAPQRIYVAGHSGLAGSAIVRALQNAKFGELILATHRELDLLDTDATHAFIAREKPSIVVICAAKVGGIMANNSFPMDFLHENLKIQTNVIEASHAVGVSKLVFLGSSCIYPRDCPQPIREDYLLTGPLEATNRPYAIAKIAGIESCWSYNRQFGTKYMALMPTNLFGVGDNYHPEHSHVLPALVRRFHEAKRDGAAQVTVWGSGNPKREFMFADDLGNAVLHLLQLPESEFDKLCDPKIAPIVNVGVGTDMPIRELAEKVAQVVGYKGQITFDTTKPDGTPRKLLDVSRMNALGWNASRNFVENLSTTYSDFLKKYGN
jgi:GDP-L-fucose synthase